MKVAIIRYNAGNIQSVIFALQRLGVDPVVTDDPEVIPSAEKVIFPGVGEAATTMEYLKKHALDDLIRSLKQPVLGICLGLQLLCRFSEEGNTDCLGIFDEEVRKFPVTGEKGKKLKVPHMGWNTLNCNPDPLWVNLGDAPFMYFVHSFYATKGKDTIAVTHYGNDFSAALHKNNFWAVQFHPEKSGTVGEQILKNFLAL